MGRKPKTKRNKDILDLREKAKLSYEKIGKIHDVSRQTVHEIYKREKERQGYPQDSP